MTPAMAITKGEAVHHTSLQVSDEKRSSELTTTSSKIECPNNSIIIDGNIVTGVAKSKLTMTLSLLKPCKVHSFCLNFFSFSYFLPSFHVSFFQSMYSIVGKLHVTFFILYFITLIISTLK